MLAKPGKQGGFMPDTIELLDAIGQNAALRYASTEQLASELERAHASEALKSAVTAGNSSLLAGEFGSRPLVEPQITHAPCREDEEPEQEGKPNLPPTAPGTGTPSEL